MGNIIIPRDAFPSKAYEVELREPLFRDRVLARRRHPGEDSRCGYTVQDLLCAMCLVSVNGQPIPDGPFPIIDRLKGIPLADAQFLITVFLSAFTVDEELAAKAKDMADKFRQSACVNFTISEADMPSGKFSVTFTNPVMEDTMRLERIYPGEQSNCGYSFEELVFADSIVAVNGEPVKKPRDPVDVIMDWPHIDAQFACAVFLKVAYIDQQKGREAERLGKLLRSGLHKPAESRNSATTKRTSSPTVYSKPADSTKDSLPNSD